MLRDGPGYPSELADKIGVSRQILSTTWRACAAAPGGAQQRAVAVAMSWPIHGSRTHSDEWSDSCGGRPGLLPLPRPTPVLMFRPSARAARRFNAASECSLAATSLQRGRGGGRVGRGHARFVVGVDSASGSTRSWRSRRRAAVAWHSSRPRTRTREKTALRFIAMSFFALAAYVAVDAVLSLFGVGEARPSLIGIVLAATSLIVMPVLRWRSAVRRELGSRSAVAIPADPAVHVSVRDLLAAGAQQPVGLVVGRPDRRLGIAAIAVRRRHETRGAETRAADGGNTDACVALLLFVILGLSDSVAQLGTTARERFNGVQGNQWQTWSIRVVRPANGPHAAAQLLGRDSTTDWDFNVLGEITTRIRIALFVGRWTGSSPNR